MTVYQNHLLMYPFYQVNLLAQQSYRHLGSAVSDSETGLWHQVYAAPPVGKSEANNTIIVTG
uniref:Uncharacterized protein n=1 Tax=Arundo donax TaxID=35708 RepID=A0A0A9E8Z3_ARUDO